MKIGNVVAAAVLGAATCYEISWLHARPWSTTGGSIGDALSLPGGWVASLVWLGGVHSDGHAVAWAITAIACNFLLYALFWFAVLRSVRRRQSNAA